MCLHMCWNVHGSLIWHPSRGNLLNVLLSFLCVHRKYSLFWKRRWESKRKYFTTLSNLHLLSKLALNSTVQQDFCSTVVGWLVDCLFSLYCLKGNVCQCLRLAAIHLQSSIHNFSSSSHLHATFPLICLWSRHHNNVFFSLSFLKHAHTRHNSPHPSL